MTASIRTILKLMCCAGIAAMAMAAAYGQVGFDRRGGDYRRFEIPSGDPEICAARCEREARCKAWTFSYPRTERAHAICWLKGDVKSLVPDLCCISGVKGGSVIEPRTNSYEYSIDRYGGDYRNFELTQSPSGRECKAACEADNRCRTWTYVRPGYLGSAARCYLKDKVTAPRRKPCCISGVVR